MKLNTPRTSKIARVVFAVLIALGFHGTQSVFAQNNYQISRNWGANTNDWSEIGSFANTGLSQYVIFNVQGHWCGSIISAQFRYDDIAYTGSSTNWMELPASNGGKVYNGTQPVAIDIKRATPSSTSDPILARIRNLHWMCSGTSLNISIDTNTTFTAGTNTGSSGAVDSGYAASDVGWKFPVTTNGHAASTDGVFVLNTGNVGIGTANPGYLLDLKLAGSGTGATIGVGDATYGTYGTIGFATAGSKFQLTGTTGQALTFGSNGVDDRVYLSTSGNVGIGMTGPNDILEANGAIRSARSGVASQYLRLSGGDASGLYLTATPDTGNEKPLIINNAGTDAASNSNIQLQIAGATKFTLANGGNVGIGKTPDTNYKLDVAGNINSTQTITANNIVAKYQDVAEWVHSSEQLAPATVVVLDSSKSNQVISSTVSYDTRVAGVISAQPGIALGEKSEGKVLVATTGRVRIKVDATKSPIRIGDLLVTSDIPGVAMKSEPVKLAGRKMHMPGTIIGKALEPMEKGTGTILVLLSLQ